MSVAIYAVRDRLIDWFMRPFPANSDKEVLGAIAQQVNSEELNGIAQAPHHYEVWKLCEVTDNGHVKEARVLIADCSSLIRSDLRKRHHTGDNQVPEAAGREPGPPGRNPYNTGSRHPSGQTGTQGPTHEGGTQSSGPQGGNRHSER